LQVVAVVDLLLVQDSIQVVAVLVAFSMQQANYWL
jgi:hypothetical protein